MRIPLKSYFAVPVFVLVAMIGCSSSDKGTEGTNGTNNPTYIPPTSTNGGAGNGNGSGAAALAKCTASVCATVASPGPSCAAEICDGLDNDCNGVIDDVDTGGDGVCDCIKIATLGVPGTWGQGDVFGAWLSARSTNGATSLGSQTLTTTLLSKYDIVIVQNVNAKSPSDNTGGVGRAYAAAEVSALSSFVNARGGLMTMTGFSDPTELSNVNSLLGSFGLNYGSRQILQKSNGATTVPVTTWFAHPTSAGVTAVGVDNGYESQSAQNLGTVVASQGGYVVGRALQSGSGRVFQWGDEWITYNSEWTQHPDYQVQLFWLNIIKWLTPPNYCQVAIPPILVN
jgi:hypothetical protein